MTRARILALRGLERLCLVVSIALVFIPGGIGMLAGEAARRLERG